MRFHADLHIHSKHSRATSRDLDLEHLSYWARRKGITVVGTGDFTHPAWIAELREKLLPAEPGLFRLREDIDRYILQGLPVDCRTPVRFMLSVEISTIYKWGDLTRKIHHLLYAPDFGTAESINRSLARIGNIAADGRPILGFDSRNLLEVTLAAGPDAYLVPAHIWTPWFAVLGSQSGFDSISDCYRDLADHVFAVETGLSSDPAMNWRLSFLDRYRLVSSSDAHSPAKLGRETTLFDCDLDYFSIKRALQTGEGYVGTVEFFPEEGKYHLDGHRKCNVRWTPEETRSRGKRCPVCGQPVTVGVLHRVAALADRTEAEVTPPPTAGQVSSLVPLPEVLSEIAASGPASKTVERYYGRLLSKLGPELWILQSAPIEDIARADSSLLAEAITRLRAGKVIRDAGYDGEYGVIRLFEASELKRLVRGGVPFDMPGLELPAAVAGASPAGLELPARSDALTGREAPTEHENPAERALPPVRPLIADADGLAGLDEAQRLAAQTLDGPLLIVAGPGSGKTRTLTYRIAHLVADRKVAAAQCLAITFTRRAALEMEERLTHLLRGNTGGAEPVAVHTFHSLGASILREHANAAGLQRGFLIAPEEERKVALAKTLAVSEREAANLLRRISGAKRAPQLSDPALADVLVAYSQMLTMRNWVDFDDLIGLAVRALESDPALAMLYRDRYRWISVDEFQDVDAQQYRLLTLLAQPDANLCVIGDPDQAIYGFRGADAGCFERFKVDYPTAKSISLKCNYRSSGAIVAASSQVLSAPASEVIREMHELIAIHVAPTERAEAEFVIQTLEGLLGGHSFFSIDSGRAGAQAREHGSLGFADFAVLYRTNAQGAVLREAFERSGIPFRQHGHDLRLERRDAAAPTDSGDGQDGSAETATGKPAAVESIDTWDSHADRVALLTLHAAKGLEFGVVFIVGLEDGILPLYWSKPDDAVLAEERRLLYVGMTRAKDRLILSRARQRQWRGRLRQLEPSPFLNDIEKELLRQHASVPRPVGPRSDQLALF